ncbi:MAG: signal peptidase II [Oscillospiraceae bacterium]|nr:signal peptidase II [Oscillospiraceae bacterium]MCL2249628.1 signal peptidase II [Oscillospiraceae bacterium]
MLIFLFSALIVALDQFFKHYIMRTLEIGERGPVIIPGILGLTRWENDGAMLNILSGQQWLLAGIAFVAAVVLVMILLRYNDGFWGSLGLASVLGGTVGNLIDRIFNDGAVVDMFRTLFINFPIFNFADIFITLGFLIFLIHFISLSIKEARGGAAYADRDDYEDDEYYEDEHEEEYSGHSAEGTYDEFPEIDSMVATQAEQEMGTAYTEHQQYAPSVQEQYTQSVPVAEAEYTPDEAYAQQPSYVPEETYTSQPVYETAPQQDIVLPDVFDSLDDITADITANMASEAEFNLDEFDLDVDFSNAEDYDVDELLREYGLDDDE